MYIQRNSCIIWSNEPKQAANIQWFTAYHAGVSKRSVIAVWVNNWPNRRNAGYDSNHRLRSSTYLWVRIFGSAVWEQTQESLHAAKLVANISINPSNGERNAGTAWTNADSYLPRYPHDQHDSSSWFIFSIPWPGYQRDTLSPDSNAASYDSFRWFDAVLLCGARVESVR